MTRPKDPSKLGQVGRPRKLTDAQIAYARDMHEARKAIPSTADLARRWDISVSNLREAMAGKTYKTRHAAERNK